MVLSKQRLREREICISTYIILFKELIGRFPKVQHQTPDDNVSGHVDVRIARSLK